jgi:hypothetical protein
MESIAMFDENSIIGYVQATAKNVEPREQRIKNSHVIQCSFEAFPSVVVVCVR